MGSPFSFSTRPSAGRLAQIAAGLMGVFLCVSGALLQAVVLVRTLRHPLGGPGALSPFSELLAGGALMCLGATLLVLAPDLGRFRKRAKFVGLLVAAFAFAVGSLGWRLTGSIGTLPYLLLALLLALPLLGRWNAFKEG